MATIRTERLRGGRNGVHRSLRRETYRPDAGRADNRHPTGKVHSCDPRKPLVGSSCRPRHAYRVSPCLVVVSGLQEIDGTVTDAIHQSVFLCDTARPAPGKHVLERFGFAGAFEGVSHDCLNQVEDPDRSGTLVLHPEPEVLKELRLEYGDSFSPSLHRASLYVRRRLFRA